MKALLRRAWFGPTVALVCVYLLFVILSPDTFARASNLATMARQTVVVAIAAVGMTLVIVHGGICLLYTSPSPRDGLLSRMPSSA